MRSAAVFFLLVPAGEAQFTGSLTKLSKPGYQRVPYGFRAPQQRVNMLPNHKSSPLYSPAPKGWRPEAAAASAAQGIRAQAAVSSPPVGTTTNIYGETLQDCAPKAKGGFGGPEYCTYAPDSPKICVDVAGFETKSVSFGVERDWTGIKRIGKSGNRCLSVWALGISSLAKGNLYGTSNFDLKCESLPSDVLYGDYTMDQWNNCDVYTKGYPTWDGTKRITEGQIVSKTYILNRASKKCLRFRRAIADVCKTCVKQAPTASAKAAISGQCEAFQEAMSRTGGKLEGDAPASAAAAPSQSAGPATAREWIDSWRANMPSELAETEEATSDENLTPGLFALASFMLVLALIGLRMLRSSSHPSSLSQKGLQEFLVHA